MTIDAEELLIRPFRDVVSLATVAVANAAAIADEKTETAARMAKAARSLVREGERALTKVQAVWDAQVQRHGDAFREMIVQQASIEKKRVHLEDLLWDFEDFTQPAEFDQERYSALHAAARALALDVIDTAKRLNPDAQASPLSPVGRFPPLPPLPPHLPQSHRSPTRSSSKHAYSVFPRRPSVPSISTARPIQQVPATSAAPLLIQIPLRAPRQEPRNDFKTSREAPSADPSAVALEDTPPMDASPRAHPAEPLARSSSMSSPTSGGLTDDSKDSFASHANSFGLSFERENTASWYISEEPVNLTDAVPGSLHGSREATTPTPATNTKPPIDARPQSPIVAEDGLMLAEELIVAASDPKPTSEQRETARPHNVRAIDCRIGAGSTYHLLKGFCKGGIQFRNDGHWSNIHRTTVYNGGGAAVGGDMLRASDGIIPFQFEEAVQVGRCSECDFAHGVDEIELDMSSSPQATRESPSGAQYRLRLLYKSHLRSESGSEASYACLWCVHTASTTHESDATVFLTADDLLRHLSGHPQPLPAVPGVSVRYGPLPADSEPHDYDLHLSEAPAPVLVPDSVAKLAMATATRDHYRRPGRGKLERPSKYSGDMLEFCKGACIVGVVFPEKWEGKWCLGRHDGLFGAFPVKAVEIREPQDSEIPASSDSGMSVVTRWKWPPSSTPGAPWLAFGKGEVISNVQCLYSDYWCWSGTNKKGKTGVFPRSHIDLQTLKERGHTESAKQSKGRGLFSRRPMSSAGTESISSGSIGSRASILS
ncbi:hypothetical protein B0H67DRAFT_571736 [Lasiosphaeris hirsuta]|uniref:SH3 domain-containing protein n=1 Tax=Lasiosphaeris hirsuta TaxID=260670 RepID=A0AA40B1C1_9PEZI|nr:hypothetical protein B0H67DRAFT_571736 [Lasiosphaeris hirsuta]